MHYNRHQKRTRRAHRGQALIVALGIILGLILLTAAVQIQVVSQLRSTKRERDYERALQMAEAGANAYFNYLANGTSTSLLEPWGTYSAPNLSSIPTSAQIRSDILNGNILLGTGSNTIAGSTYANTVGLVNYPAQASLTTKPPTNSQFGYFVIVNGTPGATATVVSYGYANGIVRRVKVVGKANQGGDFTLFGILSVSLASNVQINGNVGTDGTLTTSSNDTITGSSYLYGSSTTTNATSYTRMSSPLIFPTVDQIALKKWPNSGSTAPGGLSYLATHNDNALVSAIVNNSLSQKHGTVTFSGKAGGANYYVTDISIDQNTTIVFDNALGPITIWLGPANGTGQIQFNSNVTFSNTSTSSANPVRFYCATNPSGSKSSFDTKSNISAQISVYAYNTANTDGTGTAYGSYSAASNMSLYGTVLAYTASLASNTSITYPTSPGDFTSSEVTHYSTTQWTELP